MSDEPRSVGDRLPPPSGQMPQPSFDEAEMRKRADAVSHAAMIVRENEARARKQALIGAAITAVIVIAVLLATC